MKKHFLSAHHQCAQREHWLQKPLVHGEKLALHTWLVSVDSLTKKLKNRYTDFYVRPVRLAYSQPVLNEASILGLSSRQLVLVRDVLLYGQGHPVVFAHTVIPNQSLQGDWRVLGQLGSQPLGAALFANPKVMRRPLRYKKISQHHSLYQSAIQHLTISPSYLWARRSVFSLNCANILVTEVFLPDLLG